MLKLVLNLLKGALEIKSPSKERFSDFIATGCGFDSVIRVGSGKVTDMWVVATGVEEWGEVDNLFLEPADKLGDGMVALTQPMPYEDVIKEYDKLITERNADHPGWEQDMHEKWREHYRRKSHHDDTRRRR